jgi:hypothetical protein
MQEDRQAHANEVGSTQEYENLETGAVVNVIKRRDGRLYTTDGQPFAPAGHIPYVPTAAGGSAGKRTSLMKRRDDMQNAEITTDINNSELGTLLGDPTFLSGSATGGGNLFAMINEFQPMNAQQEKVAIARGRMDGITVDTILPMMKAFGANPSEGERQFLETGMPTKLDDPGVWFDWIESKFAVKTKEVMLRNIQEGTSGKTKEEVEKRYQALLDKVRVARATYDSRGGKPSEAEPDKYTYSDEGKEARFQAWMEGQTE